MAVTKVLQPTSFYAFIFDPADPKRLSDYSVSYVAITTFDDGSQYVGPEIQVNSKQALELGLGIVAEPLELQARLNEAHAKIIAYETDPATFWSRIKYLFTGK